MTRIERSVRAQKLRGGIRRHDEHPGFGLEPTPEEDAALREKLKAILSKERGRR